MATPVDVWAPAFAPLLDRVTADNSQAVFRDCIWCKLCETHIAGGRPAHAREHDRELRTYRSEKERRQRREAARHLRELSAERARTRKALAA